MPVGKDKKVRKDLQDQVAVATSTARSSMIACHALLLLRVRGG